MKTCLNLPAFVTLLLLFAGALPAASVTDFGAKGDGSTDDTPAFRKALSAGGTVTIPKQSGRCYALNAAVPFSGSTVAIILRPHTTLVGENNPTLCSTNPELVFVFGNSGGNVKISGIIFDGAGALILQSGKNHQVSGVTFTNNHVLNLTSLAPRGAGLLEWGILTNSDISFNTFENIWPGGHAANSANMAVLFPNTGANGSPCYNSPDGSACDIGVSGVSINGGIANTSISYNSFSQIASDGLVINMRPDQLTDASHVDATGVVIAWNEFVHIHRMGIEIGGFGPCRNANDACNFSLVPLNAPVIKANYFHSPTMPYWHTFGFSLVFNGSVNATIINNTVTNDNTTNCYGNVTGEGFEHAANSLLFQGNVISSARDACAQKRGWGGYAVLGGINTQTPQGKAVYRNNVTCGEAASHGFYAETTTAPMVVENNFQADACPYGDKTGTSGISASFTSPDNPALNASGTFNIAVVSTLSVGNVQFYLDSAQTPILTQELSDVNTAFASNRQWLYHATINTGGLPKGSHTLKAVVTDVSGAQQSATRRFTVTGVRGSTSGAARPTPFRPLGSDASLLAPMASNRRNGCQSGASSYWTLSCPE